MAHPSWHGHVSAISVAPEFRRTGVANRLMEYLEEEGSSRGAHRTTNRMGILMEFQVTDAIPKTKSEYWQKQRANFNPEYWRCSHFGYF